MTLLTREQIDRQVKRLRRVNADRLLGAGLLLAHVSLFFVTATMLILIDLYRHPSALTIGSWLRSWAALGVFHMVIVAIYPLVRRFVGTSDLGYDDAMNHLRNMRAQMGLSNHFLPVSSDREHSQFRRLRASLTQPISVGSFQGRSIEAIRHRVIVYWQRFRHDQGESRSLQEYRYHDAAPTAPDPSMAMEPRSYQSVMPPDGSGAIQDAWPQWGGSGVDATQAAIPRTTWPQNLRSANPTAVDRMVRPTDSTETGADAVTSDTALESAQQNQRANERAVLPWPVRSPQEDDESDNNHLPPTTTDGRDRSTPPVS